MPRPRHAPSVPPPPLTVQELASRADRLEDENLRLRCDLSLNSPRFRECRELLQRVLRATEEGGEAADWLTRAIGILSVMRESQGKEEEAAKASATAKTSSKDAKALLAEVHKLRSVNEILVGRVEAKEKRLRAMEEQVRWLLFFVNLNGRIKLLFFKMLFGKFSLFFPPPR